MSKDQILGFAMIFGAFLWFPIDSLINKMKGK